MANQIKYQVGFDVNKSNLESLKKSLQQIQQLSARDLMKFNNSSMEAANQALLNIKNQAINVEKALRQAFNTKLNTVNISEFNKSLTQSKTTIQNVYSAFSKAGPAGQNAFRSLSAQVLSTNIQLRQSNGLLNKMATTFINTIKWNIASSAINAMSRSIQQAWSFTKDLDTSLNDIRIVTGKSADEMANFAEQANKAAQNLGQTTTNYTKASLIYYQQGLQDGEVQARTDVTLKAANVTGQSAQQVSEQLTAVWNGYKVSADQTQVYVDRLAAVAATSASNLEELSTAMSKVASAAAAMGVGEEQLAAQLSTIISVTRQAPQSVGTALRTVFARVADIKAGVDEQGVSLGNYSKKMAQLGFNVLDMNGNLRDMGEVMEQIGNKWGDLTREQQIYLARTMAGQRQYNNLLALFDNFDMYNKELDVAKNATGTLQKQQDTYMESTAAHLKQLRASMEGIYEKLFNTEGINKLIDGLSLAANFMAKFVSSIGGGGNLLKSLGSIGMMVFSEQIARGINTAITNLEVGKQNVAQFNAALEATRQWQGIPGLDELSTKLLQNREQLLSFAGLLNPQQFTGLQSMLNEMTQAANEFSTLNTEQGFLNGVIEQIGKTNSAWKDLNNIMKDDTAQQAVIDKIKQQELAFHNVIDQIKNYHKELSQTKAQAFNGEDVTKNLTDMQNKLSKYIEEFSGLTKNAGLAEHSQQLEKLKTQLANLPKNLSAEEMVDKLRDIAAAMGGIAKSAQQAGVDLRGKLTAEFQGTVESIGYQTEEAKAKMKSVGDAWEQEVARMQRASSIEIFTRVTGSITSLAMAVNNFKNLGSIWANDDLTIGEKLLQTITNVGMGVGMIIPAYQKLKAVLEAHKIASDGIVAASQKQIAVSAEKIAAKTAEVGAIEAQNQVRNEAVTSIYGYTLGTWDQVAAESADVIAKEADNAATATNVTVEGADAAATTADAGAKTAEAAATTGAAVAQQALNAAFYSSPIGWIAAAFMALVTVLGIVASATREARKEAIQLDKANIQAADKTLEQVESNKELYALLNNLNQQYKNGQISRAELSSSIDNLISKYGLEEDAINKLITKYGNLQDAIKHAYQASLEQGIKAAQDKKKSAEDLIVSTAQEKNYTLGNNKIGFNDFQAGGSDFTNENIFQSFQKIRNEYFNDESGYLEVGANPEDLVKFFDTIEQEKTKLDQSLDATQRNHSSVYQQYNTILKDLADVVTPYKESVETIAKNSALLKASMAIDDGTIDLQSIKTANDYIEQRKILIDEMQQALIENGDTETDAAAMADVYLKDNYKNLYNSYNDAANFLKNFEEKLGKPVEGSAMQQIEKTINKLISEADDQHLAEMLAIDPAYISNWESLKNIIEGIAGLDLSTIPNQLSDIEGVKEAAAERYNTYQNVEDKVVKGETIEAKQYQELSPDIQEYFEMMANGTYKMVGDAKEFYELINNLKLDGFHNILNSIESDINRVNELVASGYNSEDYDTISQKSAYKTTIGNDDIIDYNLINQQLNYADANIASGTAMQEVIEEWQNLAQQGRITKEIAEQIVETVRQIGDQTQNLQEKAEQLKQKEEEVAHQIHDAMFPTDSDIDTEALQSMTELIQDIADKSDELADVLSEDTRAAEDVAEAILRFDDAIQDVIDNYDDWMDALENDSMQDQAEVIDDLKDAYGDLLDIDGSALSDKFLMDPTNLQLMQDAINNVEGAYQELQERAGQDILMQVGIDPTQFYADRDNIQAAMETLTGQKFDDIEVGTKLNDANFLAGLQNIINAAGMTAQQATDYLASMGVDAEVIQDTSTVRDTHQYTGVEPDIIDNPVQGYDPVTRQPVTYNFPTVTYRAVPAESEDLKEDTAFALKVTSAHKSSGGGFKFNQSKNGGGSSGSSRRSGGGGSCFAAGTLITLKHQYKNIEDIEIGDIVLSYNEKTQKNEYSTVVEKMIHSTCEDIYTLYIEDEKLIVTGNHKFFITRNNKQYWIQVADFEQNDLVLFADGTLHKISKIDVNLRFLTVYNFEVSNTHNYYVGKNQVLAHNKGGGGSGGSGKASEPDTSQKDKKKPIEDTRDIYHDINIQLQQIERQLNRVQDIQDRLYGKKLLDNLNKQTEILEKQKKKLEEKRKIQLQDLADQQKVLKSLGMTFDAYGNITNYMKKLGNQQKVINDLTNKYNAIIDRYNKETDKDKKKEIADEAEKVDKKLKEAEDNYKDLEDKIKNYDDLREDMEDLLDDVEDIIQEQIEINISKFNMQVEIRLEMSQAARDWNEFKRNVLYKDNILKDTGFDTILKDAMHSLDDVYTYFNTAGSKSILQNLTEQVLDTRAEIEKINSEGWSSIYGDNEAQAMEDLQNYFDELISQMQDMEDLINEIDEAYLDTIDDVKDQFDKQIEDFEFVGELIEHDIDLLQLLYGDKNYAAMDRYYAQLNQNNLQQLDSLRKQAQFWKEYWDAAVAEGNVADAAKFEENYREAISNLNSLIEESAENLKDKYLNSIEQIFDELDRKISNGKGTDYLSTEWQLMNKNANEYLDTINSAFAIQEVQRKYQKAIDESKNIKNQQVLKKLMDQQLENLKTKEKLTQYDVERAEKLLQIEQARMALQDAKASKTTMRLKRNAQGNYSYEYVADNSGIAEAEEGLATAQNDLYNFDKDRYNSNLEDMLSAWKDFQSEYKEIVEDVSLTEEDRVAKIALLREEYGEYINDKTAENLVIRNNLMESAFADIAALYDIDVANYQQMADDEKNILMGDLVPAWKSGIQEMTDTVVGSGGFLPTCEKAFDNITKATQRYEKQLETMSRVAGTNLNLVKNGVDILASSTKDTITNTDELIDRLNDEIDTIKNLKLAVDDLKKEYSDVIAEANKAASAIYKFIQAQKDQAAHEANKNKKANTNKNNNNSSSSTNTGTSSTSTNTNNKTSSASKTSANRSKYLDYTFKNNWPGRDFYLSGKYVGSFNGSGFTTKDAEIIQDMIDNGIWGKNYSAGAWPIYKSKTKTIDELLKSYGLKTGGYTGEWAGDSGRLALLHQKELVLNQEDTQNILDSVTILRQLLSSATGNIASKMFALNNKNSIMQSLFGEGLEQNVQISATFPNVNSKKEIEDAFNEIVNLAAQKALKR